MNSSSHVSLESIPGLAFIYQLNQLGVAHIIAANSSLRSLLGRADDAVPFDAAIFWARVSSEGRQQHKESMERALVARTPWQRSLDFLAHKAAEQAFVIQINHLDDDATALVVMLAQVSSEVQDIQIRHILDVMPDRFYYKDRRSRFVGGNTAWLKARNVSSIDEIKGKTDVDIDLYGAGKELLLKEQQQMAEGKSMRFRETHVEPDGKELFFESIKIPLLDEHGIAIGIAGMTRDITEQVLIERELIKAKDDAIAANLAKSSFLAIMSHEIRTPMNGIIGCASLLSESELNSSQKQLVSTIASCGDSLLSLVNDILDYSKIESGHVELEATAFCLRRTIEEVLQIFIADVDTKNIELTYFVPDAIPNTIVGDQLRLKQILINLVGNAIKFTHDGDVAVRVDWERLSRDSKKCILKFSVKDDGIGIRDEDLDKIFLLFQQADTSTTRRYGGTGLGLSICQKLVQLKNGNIWVESDLGKGSTFYFTAEYEFSSDKTVCDTEYKSNCLKGLRALIVDDNQTNLHVLKEIIAQWHVAATSYCSPLDALAALTSTREFDVIIIDYFMPEMDGEGLASCLKKMEAYKNTPIILLTSAIEKPVNNANIDFSLNKPVRANELLRCISDSLHKYQVKKCSDAAKALNTEVKDLRILIAEDDAVNKLVCESMLRKLGYVNIVAVNDGQLALEAVRKQTFDIIFMDIQMPVMDGIESTRKIREITQDPIRPWIIALTAGALESDSREALSSGMNQFATKPVQLKSLRRVLQRALQSKA